MDINYFINIIQQNTETIKQLNERIKLLEKSEKDDNIATLMKDVQLMKLKESNKNKQLNERIELLEIENKQLKTEIEKMNANMIKYCDIIKTLEYQSTKQRERICSLEQGFKQLEERDKLVKDTIVEFKENFTKLGFYNETVKQCLSNIKQTTTTDVPNQMKRDPNNNFNRIHITPFKYNNLKESNIVNKTAKVLCITTNHESYYGTSFKWTLDGIDNFPEVKQLSIFRGYGLHGVHETLSKTTHKINKIMLFNCHLIYATEREILLDYCTKNNICLEMDISEYDANKHIKYCSMEEHDEYVRKYKAEEDERKTKNKITNKIN